MFWEKYKKYILTLVFLGAVLFLGYLIYALFFRPVIAPSDREPDDESPAGLLPIAPEGPGLIAEPGEERRLEPMAGEPVGRTVDPVAQGGLTETVELSAAPALRPTLSANGLDLQFYNQEDGRFYRIDKDGNATLLSDRVFHQVRELTWSPKKDQAVLEYPDGSNIVYNFTANTQITLPKHWENFEFNPAGDSLVLKSVGLDPDNRFLAVSNIDGTRARPLEALGDKGDYVYPSWSPNNLSVALYAEGIDYDRQEIFFIGLNNENFKSMVVEGRGFQPLWAPSGDRLLYSVYSSANNMKPSLWIAQAQGDQIGAGRRSLNAETWAEKCVFANDSEVFCAVPRELPEGAGLFPEMANITNDQLYQINTRTGLKKLIAVPDGNFSMSNLTVSENGFYLYFTDAQSSRLHRIKLK